MTQIMIDKYLAHAIAWARAYYGDASPEASWAIHVGRLYGASVREDWHVAVASLGAIHMLESCHPTLRDGAEPWSASLGSARSYGIGRMDEAARGFLPPPGETMLFE